MIVAEVNSDPAAEDGGGGAAKLMKNEDRAEDAADPLRAVEGFARAYLEGVAAAHEQKERALKVIQKYTRLKDVRLIEELYSDSIKFLERVPRLEAEAIAPIVDFMGKKPMAVESVADNSIVDRLVREGFIDKLFKKR